MTLLQEVQSLLLKQSESNLEAIAVILRAMTPEAKNSAKKESIVGALKGKYSLPPDFLSQSKVLDEEIACEFYGDCQ